MRYCLIQKNKVIRNLKKIYNQLNAFLMRCNIDLTNDELNRYSRQIRLPEIGKEGQKRIKGSSVVVIGAGALGCPVLQYLAAAGVGTIGIVDNDWVDETNLHRQVLYTVKDIEKPKPSHPYEAPPCADAGVIGPIAGIIGSMQAIEVIKIILERKDVFSGRLFIIDSLNFTTLIFTYKRNSKFSDIRTLGDYNEFCLSGAEPIKEIYKSDLKSMIKTNPDITIIDLREDKDYCDIGFDCISIPYYEINNRISFVLEKNGVVFYCKNGIQSANVINYFQTVHKKENLYHLIL